MELAPLPLSVLDLATIGEGSDATRAVRDTLAYARRAEELGFTRFWLAEHHNMPGIASSAPAVLISAVGAATSRIRVGSGGVMLPNHPPLVVAEQFGTLSALYPGRIDLGIGRAPGTDQATAAALRRTTDPLSQDDFPRQLGELLAFLTDGFTPSHPFARIAAVPGDGVGPPIWLLGSSGYSAQVAGHLGMPFAFAHHFSAENTLPALALYRSCFRPSAHLDRPYALIAVQVICGEDDDHAMALSGPTALSFLRLRSGRPGRIPTVAEAAAYPWSPAERAFVESRRADQAVGGPDTVRRRLAELLGQTGVDELMIATIVHDPADRVASLERVRRLFGSAPLPLGLGDPDRPAVG
ncbi:MAG: LLM class flavin-dependent oxidoreductase [Myxococcota bacterium]